MVHALVSQILLDRVSHRLRPGPQRGLQRLALALNAWLDEPGPPHQQP